MFILVDANSFFCHCEKLFRPDLRNREVVVLSNNDGCVVSATRKCKEELSLKTGQPFFEIEEKCKKYNVVVFSSNFSLYTKISKRISNILKGYSREIEIYSVDESFLFYPNWSNIKWEELGRKIKDDIYRRTGMPVRVGIAKTKVLAKMCNHIAKKGDGVCFYRNNLYFDSILSKLKVGSLWGIGKASQLKLRVHGIKTVMDLKKYRNDKNLKKILNKSGLQIKEELNEISCFELNINPDKRKSIQCSRSFSYAVNDKATLQKKVSSFITNASSRLREEESKTSLMEIFLIKKTYVPDLKNKNHSDIGRDSFNDKNKVSSLSQNYTSVKKIFQVATSDTFFLIEEGLKLLDQLFESHQSYKKIGVLFHDLTYKQLQLSLFEQPKNDDSLTSVMDMINSRFNKDLVFSASCLGERSDHYRQNHSSPNYLVNWSHLPVVS